MEDLFEEEEQDSKFPTDTAFVQRHRHAAMQVCMPSQWFHLPMCLLVPLSPAFISRLCSNPLELAEQSYCLYEREHGLDVELAPLVVTQYGSPDVSVQNGDGGDDDSPSGDGQTDLEEFSSSNEDNIVTTAPREVYIVDSVPKAQAVLGRLQAIHAANPDTIFACDTEVPHSCLWPTLTAKSRQVEQTCGCLTAAHVPPC